MSVAFANVFQPSHHSAIVIINTSKNKVPNTIMGVTDVLETVVSCFDSSFLPPTTAGLLAPSSRLTIWVCIMTSPNVLGVNLMSGSYVFSASEPPIVNRKNSAHGVFSKYFRIKSPLSWLKISGSSPKSNSSFINADCINISDNDTQLFFSVKLRCAPFMTSSSSFLHKSCFS